MNFGLIFFFLSIYNIIYTRVYKIQIDIVDVRAYMCLVCVQLIFGLDLSRIFHIILYARVRSHLRNNNIKLQSVFFFIVRMLWDYSSLIETSLCANIR